MSDKQSMRILFLLSILMISLKVKAQTLCPNSNHIFLIHGIGGSSKTFGQMDKYLKRVDACYEVHTFVYDTGNSQLSTYDFANHFHQFLMEKVNKEEIRAFDKISLIMHSQGGVVGNLWLDLVRQANPALYNQIDAFITLSTPHWGAEIANVGRHVLFTLPEGVNNPISPFGRIELNEMSYGSRTIENLNTIINQNIKPLNFRPLAVGGIHKIKNKVIGENDTVVPIFSSRPDHYVARAEVQVNVNAGLIPDSIFAKTNLMPFVTVAATHLKFDLPGIVAIPEKCLESKGCDHPSLPVITDHLQGRSIASTTEKLDHFRANIYLSNASGDKFEKKDVDLDILDKDNISIPLSQKIKNFRGESKRDEGLAFSFHGNTKRDGPQKLRVLLKFKNKFERVIEIPVEGGYSSVIHLTLK